MSLANFQNFGSLTRRTIPHPGVMRRGSCALLEPSPALGEAVTTLVESLGLKVVRFEDIHAFQRASLTLRSSLIIMDAEFVNAEDRGFLDLIGCEKGCRQSRPPIIITAHADRWEKIVEGLSAGADEYIIKPFDPQVLLSKLCCLGVV